VDESQEIEKKVQPIMGELKHSDGIGLRDYINLFSFSIGVSGMVLYLIVSILAAAL
jgi:hypothetical protein